MKALLILQEAAPIAVEPRMLTWWDKYLMCGWAGHVITLVILLALLQMWRALRGRSSKAATLALCLIPALMALTRAFQATHELLMSFASYSRSGHNTWSYKEGDEALRTCLYGGFASLGLVVIFVLLFSVGRKKNPR